MTLLVTGATGFVMSVVARHWLETDPTARVVLLDASPLDATAQRYFAPFKNRLSVVLGDVTQPGTWRAPLDGHAVTHIVHGATVTPLSRGTAAEAKREPEAENPGRIVDVNVMGTVAMLDWARTQPNLKRFIYVSSGAVYKHHGPDRPGEPLPEDGYVMPRRLYGISKLASELITERYGDLFNLSTASVRPSSVYGPMDRVTASRNFRHVPNRIAHLALDGGKRVRVNTLEAVGDYIHVEDVASGIAALLRAPRLHYCTYNVAQGSTASIADMVKWAAEKAPGFHAEIVPAEHADIVQDPSLRDGMWGAYDCRAIGAETGWKPRPMREALHAYMDWIVAERSTGAGAGGAMSPEAPYPATWSAMATVRRIPAGRTRRASPSRWYSTTRKAARRACCTATQHSESVLTDLGAEALPGARNLNVESNFEYGSRVGVWEILRVLKSAGAPATVFAVGMALERNPEVAAEHRPQRLRGRLPRPALDRLPVRPRGARACGHAAQHRRRSPG